MTSNTGQARNAQRHVSPSEEFTPVLESIRRLPSWTEVEYNDGESTEHFVGLQKMRARALNGVALAVLAAFVIFVFGSYFYSR